MRTPLLFLVVAAIVLAIIVGAEQPVAAGILTPPMTESGNTPVIRVLQRPSKAESAFSTALRDPFFAQDRAPVATNASAYSYATGSRSVLSRLPHSGQAAE